MCCFNLYSWSNYFLRVPIVPVCVLGMFVVLVWLCTLVRLTCVSSCVCPSTKPICYLILVMFYNFADSSYCTLIDTVCVYRVYESWPTLILMQLLTWFSVSVIHISICYLITRVMWKAVYITAATILGTEWSHVTTFCVIINSYIETECWTNCTTVRITLQLLHISDFIVCSICSTVTHLTYTVVIFEADVHLLHTNKIFHYVYMAFCSCHVYRSSLMNRQKKYSLYKHNGPT